MVILHISGANVLSTLILQVKVSVLTSVYTLTVTVFFLTHCSQIKNDSASHKHPFLTIAVQNLSSSSNIFGCSDSYSDSAVCASALGYTLTEFSRQIWTRGVGTSSSVEHQAGVGTAGVIQKTKSWKYCSSDTDFSAGLHWWVRCSCEMQKQDCKGQCVTQDFTDNDAIIKRILVELAEKFEFFSVQSAPEKNFYACGTWFTDKRRNIAFIFMDLSFLIVTKLNLRNRDKTYSKLQSPVSCSVSIAWALHFSCRTCLKTALPSSLSSELQTVKSPSSFDDWLFAPDGLLRSQDAGGGPALLSFT